MPQRPRRDALDQPSAASPVAGTIGNMPFAPTEKNVSVAQTGAERRWIRDPAALYGLLAVLAVAATQLYLSLRGGGFFYWQWYPAAGVVAALLVGGAFVPGYFASIRRVQWVVAGLLLLYTAIVAASMIWSIAPRLSLNEASRTAMYAGVFVLLLPAAQRWGWLIVDATILGAFLPQAVYGLGQKIYPEVLGYTGFLTMAVDPKVSSTMGYHPTYGLMCAMGALLAISRVGSFKSMRSTPVRALYSALSVVFLVAMYFSFSRGALIAAVAGAVVLLLLSKYRFETLGNLAVSVLPTLWVVQQARDLPALVTRPASDEAIRDQGLAIIGPLLTAVVVAAVAQVAFSLLLRSMDRSLPRDALRWLRIAGATVALVVLAGGLFLGWARFQEAGGVAEVRSQITTSDAEEQAEAVQEDQTQRLSSLSAANRIALWQFAWQNFRDHPLTGTGGDTYQVVYEQEAPLEAEMVLHPHSMWMSQLSDTGIFAFLSFVAFIIGSAGVILYSAFAAGLSRATRAVIAGSAAAAAAYLVSASVDWHWYITASTLPFHAVAAVAVGSVRLCRYETPA